LDYAGAPRPPAFFVPIIVVLLVRIIAMEV
jgi:hypothetical protein